MGKRKTIQIKEAAKLLDVSTRTIVRMIDAGKIDSRRLNVQRKPFLDSVEKLLESSGHTGQTGQLSV